GGASVVTAGVASCATTAWPPSNTATVPMVAAPAEATATPPPFKKNRRGTRGRCASGSASFWTSLPDSFSFTAASHVATVRLSYRADASPAGPDTGGGRAGRIVTANSPVRTDGRQRRSGICHHLPRLRVVRDDDPFFLGHDLGGKHALIRSDCVDCSPKMASLKPVLGYPE